MHYDGLSNMHQMLDCWKRGEGRETFPGEKFPIFISENADFPRLFDRWQETEIEIDRSRGASHDVLIRRINNLSKGN